MLAERNFFRVRTGLFQFLLKPDQRLSGVVGAVAQAVEQLRRESRVAGMRRIARHDVAPVLTVAGRQHAIRHIVGDLPHLSRPLDAHRDAAKVLDQHEAQQRRQRPQLADAERLDALVAVDQRLQHLRRHGAVGMRHIGPGDRQRSRDIAPARNFHRRQLLVEARRQITLDLEDRLLDEIIVVEQPLRGRRYRLATRLGGIGRAIGLKDFRGIVAVACLKVELVQPVKALQFIAGQACAQRPQTILLQESRSDRLLSLGGKQQARSLGGFGPSLNIHEWTDSRAQTGKPRRTSQPESTLNRFRWQKLHCNQPILKFSRDTMTFETRLFRQPPKPAEPFRSAMQSGAILAFS